jgi:hypothetical protein
VNYDTINFLRLGDIRDLIESVSSCMKDHVLYVCLSLIDSRPACPLCQSKNVHRHGYVTKKMTHSVINHLKVHHPLQSQALQMHHLWPDVPRTQSFIICERLDLDIHEDGNLACSQEPQQHLHPCRIPVQCLHPEGLRYL